MSDIKKDDLAENIDTAAKNTSPIDKQSDADEKTALDNEAIEHASSNKALEDRTDNAAEDTSEVTSEESLEDSSKDSEKDIPQGDTQEKQALTNALKTWLKILVGLILIMGMAAGYIVWDLTRFAQSPLDSTAEETIFDVEKGMSFNQVAVNLKAVGLISSVERFKILGHFAEATGKLQAVHFAVSAAMSPQDILDILLYGKSVLYRVTIQEGLPWWKIGKLLEEEGFTTYRDFQAVVHDPDFLRRFAIPFDSAEGFLFPDTYLLRRPRVLDRAAAEAVASRLVDTFWQMNTGVFPEGMKTPVDTLKKLVILASIVEKETNKAEERATVAGVYTNRLRIPMRLQADPTVIYGIGPSFDGNITRAHLKDDSNPYNTYRHDGLPPGPICSMGKKALEAAANPEKHKYLYFVAKGGGLHHFSKSYEEHKRAVNKYIRKK